MSVQKICFYIYYPEEKSLDSLERLSDVIQRTETILITTHAPLRISKLQIQPTTVYGYYLSLSKATYYNFGIGHIKVTTVVSSYLDPETSLLNIQLCFVSLISSNLEPDITITRIRKIFFLDDLAPDLFRLENIIHSNEVYEYGISELSRFRNRTQMFKVTSFHQKCLAPLVTNLCPSPCRL